MGTDPTQKEMLQELVRDVKYIKEKQESMKIKQDDMQLVMNDMQITLIGTSCEPERGLVSRLKKNETAIAKIKTDQNKIFTWAIVVVAAINGLFFALKALITFIKGG